MIAALVLEPLELWWARRTRPELRSVPLVVAERNRVSHATPLARKEGIVPGMALAGARLRCEALQVVETSEAELQAAWESVLHELYGLSPFLDGSRRGRVFMNISAAEARMVAEAYDARVGHADGCEIAELAALATVAGECRNVPEGGEAAFLAKLPLRFLQGVGLSGYSLQRLSWLGLSTAGELTGWRRSQLRAFLGKEADGLMAYLLGPWRERLRLAQPPAALRRTARFAEPLFEPGALEGAIRMLAEALSEALDGRSSGRLTVTAEVGGVELRATRFAKKPLRSSREITLLAGLALADTGAAPVGIEALSLELPEPVRLADQGRLWPARERREAAWEELLERFPRAAVEVEWLDPHAESSDLAWRWRRPAVGDEHRETEPVEAHATGRSTREQVEQEQPVQQPAREQIRAGEPRSERERVRAEDPGEVKREKTTAAGTGRGRGRQAQTGELVLGR